MPENRRRASGRELNLESMGIQPPYSMQAEQSVLGAVLLKPEVLTDLVEIVRPEMFYASQNGRIYAEMVRPVYRRPDHRLCHPVGRRGVGQHLCQPRRGQGLPDRPGRDGAQHLQRQGVCRDRPGKIPGPPADGGGRRHPAGRRRRAGRLAAAGKRRAAPVRDPLGPGLQRPDPPFFQHGGDPDQPAEDQRPRRRQIQGHPHRVPPAGHRPDRPGPGGPDHPGGPAGHGQIQLCAEHRHPRGHEAAHPGGHLQPGNDQGAADQPHPLGGGGHRQPGFPHRRA